MLNVGIIGFGTMGRSHAQIYDKIPFVRVLGVCDASERALEQARTLYGARTFGGFQDLMDDPQIQAVSICLPDNLHVEASLAAMRAGKHVLLEKPVADTLENARLICEAARDYAQVFTLGYNLRCDARYARLRDAVAQGHLGEIVHIACRRNSGIGGPLRFVGHTDLSMHVMVHDINVVNWLMSSPPKSVFAKRRDVVLKQYGMTDTILAILTYENGAIASFEASWIMNENWPRAVDDQLEVVGTKGAAYVDNCGQGFRLECTQKIFSPDTRYRPVLNSCYAGALGEEILHFVNCVSGRAKPLVGVEEGLWDLRVVNAIERSARSGKEEAV